MADEYLRRPKISASPGESQIHPDKGKSPYLVVGLGNPGRQYKDNRHNVGFMLVDKLAARLEATFHRVQFRALIADIRFHGHRLILVKPQTYMNDSGVAVGSLVKFYKIPLENALVIYDDGDLPLGLLRVRPSGGSGGQKGMASIIEHLGSQEFPRLRIGIGRPSGSRLEAIYLLQNFSIQEKELLGYVLDRGVEAVIMFMTEGLEKAMSQFNGQVIGEI
jgi:PTH1 family peptidyl-tRNA hydrolase